MKGISFMDVKTVVLWNPSGKIISTYFNSNSLQAVIFYSKMFCVT